MALVFSFSWLTGASEPIQQIWFCSHRCDVPYGEGFFLTWAGATAHAAADSDSPSGALRDQLWRLILKSPFRFVSCVGGRACWNHAAGETTAAAVTFRKRVSHPGALGSKSAHICGPEEH